MRQFTYQTHLPHPQKEVFDWHMRSGALGRLLPPWDDIRVESRPTGILQAGSEVHLALRLGPLRLPWHALHTSVTPPTSFEDIQKRGPFAQWAHRHSFLMQQDGTILKDEINYALPLSPVSDLVAGRYVRNKLERMFRYRHRTLTHDLNIIKQYALPPRHILISGASGLVGTALEAFLTCAGHTVSRLVRREPTSQQEIYWNPAENIIDPQVFETVDAVIHLSGESIAGARWSKAQKEKIINSRIRSTTLLSKAIVEAEKKPSLLLTASGIGYYGDQGDALLTEASPRGSGFLPEVAEQWENAAGVAKDDGIRVAHMRLGAVLSPRGGALAKMLLPFSLGLGGTLGNGKQYFPWIALDDVLYAVYHVLASSHLSGPINFCAPQAITNSTFTQALGDTLHRPTLFPVPAIMLKLLLGQMAEELLLASTRAHPSKLLDSGFSFSLPDISPTLSHLLGLLKEDDLR